MQISAVSSSPNFLSGNSYVKKNKRLFFNNFPWKIGKFELEVVDVGILGSGVCFQGSHQHIL